MSDYRLRPGYEAIHSEMLPDGWGAGQIGDFVRIVQGGRLGLTKENDYVSHGIAAYSASGQDGFVEQTEFSNIAGVILSAIGANCGRCFYAEGNWTTLANVQALIPTEKLDARFLYYRANTENYWTRSGSAQPFIKPSSIKSAWIAYPKPRLQRRIAEILSTVDEAMEQTEALIAKLQQMKAGLMHDLFTRGVTQDGNLRPPREEAPELFQESSLGWIPKEWQVVRMGQLLSGIDAGWSPECIEIPPPSGEWGILKVSAATRGVFDENEAKTLPSNLKPLPELEVRPGDVITARANGVAALVGITVQVPPTCQPRLMLSDKLLRLNPGSENLGSFVAGLMASAQTRRQLAGLMSGSSGQRNISQNQIKGLSVPEILPDEQRRIEAIMTGVHFKLTAESNALAKLQQQKQGLMQDLLTGRVPVPI